MMRHLAMAILALLASIASPTHTLLAAHPTASGPRIEFYYTEGCDTCRRIEHEILPQLEVYYPDQYQLHRYDINVESNYLRLAAHQESLPIDPHATSVLVVNARRAFSDWTEISRDFIPYIGERITQTLAPAPPADAPPAPDPMMSSEQLAQRVQRFTWAGVAVAGLVDGINPCAISTLVFFISILSVMHVTGRRLIWAGTMFCMVSFITYMAIGFGLFRVLYLFTGYPMLRAVLEWGMVLILLSLAILSVIDALRYRARGHSDAVRLKLPQRISDTIHRLIRSGLSTRRIMLGSALTAFLVTVLESVCTGQVYVPTLVLVLRSGHSTPLVLSYLLLYNTLFILPLVGALILAYHGTRTPRFVHWSRANVVPSKLAMAALFVALALLIAML